MSNVKWEEVKNIFNAAARLSPDLQMQFIRERCGDDQLLYEEVASLLALMTQADRFLETPAVVDLASTITKTNQLKPGECLAQYEITGLIGSGGMGEVYLARDKKLDRRVALKVLGLKFSKHEINRRRFIREAKAASSLNHPNILVIHEIGETEDTHFIVSEYIEGQTLRQLIGKRQLKVGVIIDISLQVTAALSAAHQAGIVHRDIKPENIILRRDGLVKVVDFGLAKLIEPKTSIIGLVQSIKSDETAQGIILGTVEYMSPEQARGEKVDQRTDIFSLGVLMYEMISGLNPFSSASVKEILNKLLNHQPQELGKYRANLPDELREIVFKMMAKDKTERFQTIGEVTKALTSLK
jgi:serine/threonine protein kinase